MFLDKSIGLNQNLDKSIGLNQTQVSNEPFLNLFQRLCEDNKEYSEHLERLNVEGLELDEKGKVIDDKALVFCRETVIKFFEQKFMRAFIDANMDNEDFRIFINDIFPKLVSKLEVFYGVDKLNNLIITGISNTENTTCIYTPILFQEVLSFVSEWAFKNEDKKIVFYSFWEEDLYDRIFSYMVKLGNVQVRRLLHPYGFFVALRDESELVLAPVSSNLEGIISIKSTDGEFINFYKTIYIPILNGASIPLN